MDELEQQAQEELNAMYSGTNESEEINDSETTEDESQEESQNEPQDEEDVESEEDSQDGEDHDKPKTKKEKTEERFKKILSKKNDLAARVAELENSLADKDFYSEKPQALKYKDEISTLVSERWFTRTEAFDMIAGRDNLSSKPKGFVGKPKTPEQPKGIKDMDSKELEKAFAESWGLEWLMN